MFTDHIEESKFYQYNKRRIDAKYHIHHRQQKKVDDWNVDKTIFTQKNSFTISSPPGTSGKRFNNVDYFCEKSNANKRLRNTTKSRINSMRGKKAENFDDEISFPFIENKKLKTWWDCGYRRHHRIL
jgi:hypothetical protein